MKIPGFNLWNWPTQRELENINSMKAEKNLITMKSKIFDIYSDRVEQKIKELEFLYYCHSCKFPK